MHCQMVSLTEPYDIAIALKYVEKETVSDEPKYRILKTNFKPDEDFASLKTYLRGYNRSCTLSYLNNLFTVH